MEPEDRKPPADSIGGPDTQVTQVTDGAFPVDQRVGESLDLLIDYLMAHDVKGIHPLIMAEVERRLVIKALERSRGNKAQAAKTLGIGRNTFLRKIRGLAPPEDTSAPREGKS